MTASILDNYTILNIQVIVHIETFMYSRWSQEYPLLGSAMILAMKFINEIPQEINLSTNILHLPGRVVRGLNHNDQKYLISPSVA
jgi:hypothetical protein